MKLLGLRIKGFQQFRDLILDFSDGNGNPLKKICFIGRNGTGKSILLDLIKTIIGNVQFHFLKLPYCFAKYQYYNKIIYNFSSAYLNTNYFIKAKINEEQNWFEIITSNKNNIEQNMQKYQQYFINSESELQEIKDSLQLKANSHDLLIYSPPESVQNTYLSVNDVPNTNLNDALEYFKAFGYLHIVSENNVQDFWKLLIYLLKKRENERELFETREENLNKTKKQLIEEFDKNYPKILEKLAVLWNKILGQAGLEFDIENANKPIQLKDNLKAYILVKCTKKRINYDKLSTGIRNFIFRVGHIYSLYFSRSVKNGFLLLDEPENSLFPDFLFDLVDTYQEIVIDKNGENNTQLFVATHNPIIAAQFKPEERIVLEWNEDGYVDAYKGIAPEGDDPNDVLIKDFKLSHVMGKKGQEMWERYIALRKKLRHTLDDKEKKEIVAEINKIGDDYNFEE